MSKKSTDRYQKLTTPASAKRSSNSGLKEQFSPPSRDKHRKGLNKPTDPSKVTDDPVSKQPYFCGLIPRLDAEMILTKEGEFVVRRVTKRVSENMSNLCVCVRWNKKVHHVVPRITEHRKYAFGKEEFETVEKLVNHYHKSGAPISTKSDAKLLLPFKDSNWFLRDEQLEPDKLLGKGNFGQVWCAKLKSNPGTNEGHTKVAVKFLLDAGVPESERNIFFSECRKLRQLKHRHLVGFVGLIVDTEPIKLVMEFCNDSLLRHLREDHPELRTKARIGLHVARGMEYLASRKVIHRDLAARNCLIKNNIVKVSDLGMSKIGKVYHMKHGPSTIPIKWTCPISFKQKRFGEYSDVWSYGVLLWEVLTDGQPPYFELQKASGLNFTDKLMEFLNRGERLPVPPGTPSALAQLMLSCMDANTDTRPTFAQIRQSIESAFVELGGQLSFAQQLSEGSCHDSGESA